MYCRCQFGDILSRKGRHEGMHFSMVMTISEAMRWDTKMLDHEAVILEEQNIFYYNYYMLIGFFLLCQLAFAPIVSNMF